MPLATRCPACGTVFRVVQDQLRVSNGWVRCGRCAEVFNAVERLIDVEPESPPLRPSSGGTHRDRVIEELARVAGQPATAPEPCPGDAVAPVAEPGGDSSRTDSVAPAVPTAVPAIAAVPSVAPEPTAERSAEADEPSQPETATVQAPGPAPDSTTEPTQNLPADPPPFVREARRAATWRGSPQRRVLAGMVLLAAAALVLQGVLAYRDQIAARWAVTRAPLAVLCSALGCRVEPPRMVDALVVDSSGLVRIDQSPNHRLTVVLRNRAPIELAVPAIDLTLTDARSEVIARRVLHPADFGLTQASLGAGGDLSMEAMLAVADPNVSGYTIEVFYP